MTILPILRIVLMILGIYAAGVATGRYTMPPPASKPTDATVEVSGQKGRAITPQVVTLYFHQKLRLGPRQRQAVLAEAESFVREIATTEPGTRARHDIFRKYRPRIRTLLRPDQAKTFDALMKEHDVKMEEALKAKAGN